MEVKFLSPLKQIYFNLYMTQTNTCYIPNFIYGLLSISLFLTTKEIGDIFDCAESFYFQQQMFLPSNDSPVILYYQSIRKSN